MMKLYPKLSAQYYSSRWCLKTNKAVTAQEDIDMVTWRKKRNQIFVLLIFIYVFSSSWIDSAFLGFETNNT